MRERHAVLLLISIAVLSFSDVPALAEMIVDTAWVRTYNGPDSLYDEATAMTVDDSGHVYVTGYSAGSATSSDYTTIKYDRTGDTEWIRRYNDQGNGWDVARAIVLDDAGNVYVTGFSQHGEDRTTADFTTVKYGPDGDTAWVSRYNGPADSADVASAMAVDGSAHVYVTGTSKGSGSDDDYTTIKYQPNGDTAWIRIYNGPGNSRDYAHAIAVDPSANVYVSGCSGNSFAVIKYRPDGDTAWVRRYDEPPLNCQCDGVHMAVDHSGNIYIAGTSDNGYVTIKYYPNGDTAWGRIYPGPSVNSWHRVRSIAVDNSGYVFVAGWCDFPTADYVTIKYYPDGDTAWVRRYDGPVGGWEEARSLKLDLSGNVYVTGRSQGNDSIGFATVKYCPDGETAWVRRDMRPEYDWPQDSALAIDASGNVYVSGSCDLDWITIKYFQAPRGDANRDGSITVGDAVYLLNFLFKEGPAPDPFEVGDATCNGYVTLSDGIFLLNYLFKGGPPPDC